MPKYMILTNYTAEGLSGLAREGGTSRRASIARVVESVGGTLLHAWWSADEPDVVLVADLPDDIASLALEMKVRGSGMIADSYTILHLLEAEDLDRVMEHHPDYRAPGATAQG